MREEESTRTSLKVRFQISLDDAASASEGGKFEIPLLLLQDSVKTK